MRIIQTFITAAVRGGPDGAEISKERSGSVIRRQTVLPRRCSMSGNRSAGIILQERDRRLLAELDVMRIMDRESAKVAVGFKSTTRANTRLLVLTKSGLLRRF